MLDLDDPRWSALSHAYGAASDLPAALRALRRGDDRADQGILHDLLWGRLCHQGTVYTATYAALPHVVAIGAQRPAGEQLHFWMFAGAVARSQDAADVPADLREDVEQSVRKAHELVVALFRPGLDEHDALWLAAAVAGLRGQSTLALIVEGTTDEELCLACTHCHRELFVDVREPPFLVRDEVHPWPPGVQPTRVVPRPPRAQLRALAELLADARLEAAAARVLALDGSVTCPGCGHELELIDTYAVS